MLKKIVSICIALIFVITSAAPIKAQSYKKEDDPYVEYNFINSLTDEKNNSILTPFSKENDGYDRNNIDTKFGIDDNGPYWSWKSSLPRGGGFKILFNKDLKDEYSIGMKFSFDEIKGRWKKIIDYKDSKRDTGFYYYDNGKLQFYPHSASSYTVKENEVIDLIAVRNKENKFIVYIKGSDGKLYEQLNISDVDSQAIPETIDGNTILGFFFDDTATSNEATPGGKIYNLVIWDKAVEISKITEELDNGNVIVKHVNEDNEEIAEKDILEGHIGDDYNTTEKTIPGYKFKEMKVGSAPISGKFSKQMQYVTYVYEVNSPLHIKYDGNGNESGTVPVDLTEYNIDDEVTVLDSGDLKRDGYEFNGWNTKPDGKGTQYDVGSKFKITKETTLYASWKEVEFNVKYKGNGNISGTVPTDSKDYKLNEEVIVLDGGDLKRDGYEFNGWNTKPDGKGAQYDVGSKFKITEETTLYASWKEVEFNVVYKAVDATSGEVPIDKKIYKINDEVTVLNNGTAERKGYKFVGWNTRTNGSGITYRPGDKFKITRDTKLYIIWEKDDDGDGGGGTVIPPSKKATAVLANGSKYTDVLTATVLANERNCPILLTGTDSISTETLNELKRRGTGDIIISGGVD
ncbi:InlB B-repeat-containing protein, partial [Peptostreptococcus faecalis]|uniref:InlB B-repeat-containing protein n=1 Tax=Peptostreptococcus faecalis TaxID=2045015 RepID=UPI0015E10B75